MATAMASVNLANDIVPAISSSGVANITHFKKMAGSFAASYIYAQYKLTYFRFHTKIRRRPTYDIRLKVLN
jgi:hypothetical protein